ncbi:39S ribosomal protein L14, mitochondrial [Gadus chalcogrammus]|uniref:39S ribosomal protein L14, mitochondrial n=1 Tax=Gadus chalcogrammus TaxID=1042646 RepID=UPI0024C4DBE4|nr:39S ribosomal protein L14, mitochondrial [Gadus chalcogrammus]
MALLNRLAKCKYMHLACHALRVDATSFTQHSAFSVSAVSAAIQKMTRVRVVDNSPLGNTPHHRAPRVIHVYTKNGVGKVGDKVLLAIKGQKKKALIVGHKMPGERMTPRFDSNNVVLIEDNGNPTGTRIRVPVPTHLRKLEGDYSKLLAIASRFV